MVRIYHTTYLLITPPLSLSHFLSLVPAKLCLVKISPMPNFNFSFSYNIFWYNRVVTTTTKANKNSFPLSFCFSGCLPSYFHQFSFSSFQNHIVSLEDHTIQQQVIVFIETPTKKIVDTGYGPLCT